MNFREKVFQITKQIPQGKVTSYGQVAALCGSPHAARQVGWALASLAKSNEESIPWWRVLNSKGYLSIRGTELNPKMIQKSLLEREGVEVDGEALTVDMQVFGWHSSI